jgi:hypothetical protein
VYNIVVQPDMQATFGITLKPAHQLQAHEYTAAMSVFYESDTELFASTFFNSTVNVQVQPPPCPNTYAFTAAAAASSAAALTRCACIVVACSSMVLASATSAVSGSLRSPCFSASTHP